MLDDVIGRWTGRQPARRAITMSVPDIALRAQYRARKADTLERLDRLIREGRLTGVAVEELSTVAHKLAGVAALFGEPDLGEDACRLVDTLDTLPRIDDAAALKALRSLHRSMAGS
jgi:hypothetical protein